jgi:predicted transcriptional regulator
MTLNVPLSDGRLLHLLVKGPKRTCEITINIPDYVAGTVVHQLHRLADRGVIVRESLHHRGYVWRLPE